MQQQLITMLQLQEAMNLKVNADWREQGFEWYRAIWVECAELMDHYGWKWWKQQTPDTDQVVLELIDIWHFGLSLMLLEVKPDLAGYSKIASEIAPQLHHDETDLDFKQDLEAFTETTLRTKAFSIPEFNRLMLGVGLTFDQLFSRYVGKNVLNIFRQEHGYKEGSYSKIWSGREDNEHLIEAIDSLDQSRPDLQQALYSELEARYPN
ncbi:dUTP diphosphatase [Teredinibacter waterburyi]|jgi:dUTPase.|uniref:dUTP diphosphatase n=1 Tax=Teredinibacter waterburyi TaxID=1500538 RepID=UPI00165FAA46|nr:dUTP diphosphatase [Teredinibacter waterburyi]